MIDSSSKFVVWGIVHRCSDDTHVVLLENCLKSIREIYQWHHIIIVDSDSPKKDHLPSLCKKYRAEVADVINTGYECGAWKIIYEQTRKQFQADFYCFIHDSCWLVRPLGETLENDLAAYRCVPNTPERWYGAPTGLREAVIASLENTTWSIPDNFWTLVGQIFFAKPHIVSMLYENGFFDILPTNKFEAQCWERRLGICLCQKGHSDVLAQDSNQIGCWRNMRPLNHKMAKHWLNRQ